MTTTENLNPYKSWGKYTALCILFLTFTFNLLSRYLLIFQYSIPLDPDLSPEQRKYQSIKESLNLTSSQYGLLTGPAFMAFFALFNLFSGYIADNFNRRITMTIGLFCTSLSIGLIYWVREFWQLFLLRGLLAMGQAFFAPLGYSMIAAYFPEYKTTANSIFASGVYSGYGLASLSLLLLPLPNVGWRNLSAYVSILGIFLSIIFFMLIFEPKRPQDQINAAKTAQKAAAAAAAAAAASKTEGNEQQQQHRPDTTINGSIQQQQEQNGQSNGKDDGNKKNNDSNFSHQQQIRQLSWSESVLTSLKSPHVIALIAIFIPRLSGGAILGAFFPVLMKTRFPHLKTKFAGLNAIVVSSGGILSSLIGGFLTDKWVSINKENEKLKELEEKLLLESDYDSSITRNNDNNYSNFGREYLIDSNGYSQHHHDDDNDDNDNDGEVKSITIPQKIPEKSLSLRPYLYITSLSCLLSLGAFAGVFLSSNLYLSMGLLFIAYLFSECYFAPMLSVFYTTSTLPSNIRSTALSVSLGISQLIASFTPVIFGYIDDYNNGEKLQIELLIGVLAPNATAGLFALITGCIVD